MASPGAYEPGVRRRRQEKVFSFWNPSDRKSHATLANRGTHRIRRSSYVSSERRRFRQECRGVRLCGHRTHCSQSRWAKVGRASSSTGRHHTARRVHPHGLLSWLVATGRFQHRAPRHQPIRRWCRLGALCEPQPAEPISVGPSAASIRAAGATPRSGCCIAAPSASSNHRKRGDAG